MIQKLACLFPGQGTQYPGMGRDFYDHFLEAREIFEAADDFLKRKLSSLIFQGSKEILTKTEHSQLAIFVTSVAIWTVIQKQFPNIRPSVCAGLSLGEYSAAFSAGLFSFEKALQIVEARGRFMSEACETSKGGMHVVLGLDSKTMEDLITELKLKKDLWAANFNCPGQVVISGTAKGLKIGEEAAKKAGAKRVLPLDVHGAFHSGLMKDAEERLAPMILTTELKAPTAKLVMNVPGNYSHDLTEIKNNLIAQVSQPVRWQQGVERMEEDGVSLYIEMGPGKTLAGFNKRLPTKANTLSIEKISDLDQLCSI